MTTTLVHLAEVTDIYTPLACRGAWLGMRRCATVAEQTAARADTTVAISRHIEFLIDAYATAEQPLSVAEACERTRVLPPAALSPQGGAEGLIVQQMAIAMEQIRW